MHTCMHAYTHTYIHAYIYYYVYIHTYIHICIRTYVRTYIPTYDNESHIHTMVYVRTYTRMYARTHATHTHIHTYIMLHVRLVTDATMTLYAIIIITQWPVLYAERNVMWDYIIDNCSVRKSVHIASLDDIDWLWSCETSSKCTVGQCKIVVEQYVQTAEIELRLVPLTWLYSALIVGLWFDYLLYVIVLCCKSGKYRYNNNNNICIYTNIHTYIHIYIHTYIRTYVRTYVCMYVHATEDVDHFFWTCPWYESHRHTMVYVCTHARTHARKHTRTHTYTYTYIHTYIHIIFSTCGGLIK